MKKYISILALALLGVSSLKAQTMDVDLGLSVKWADKNLGATAPTDYGDYFAWGELSTKTTYNRSTYKWWNETERSMTNGEVRELTWDDDVAHKRLGGKWRLPTKAEVKELLEGCFIDKTTSDGIVGFLFTSRFNGRKIFIPAAGYFKDDTLSGKGAACYYWTSQVDLDETNITVLENDHLASHGAARYYGFPVRAVRDY